MAQGGIRMTAEQRRESVIRAAIIEFARGGYAGTPTASIARRVGVSQPYLFRLFPDKRAIFLAAARRCTDEIRERFAAASEGLPPAAAHEAMARAYNELITDRDRLLFQMQSYVAVATAEEEGDPGFGVEVRAAWAELWDLVASRLGGDDEASEFMGTGMLINTLLALGFRQEHRFWAGLGPDEK